MREIKEHKCSDCTHTITIYEHNCMRCSSAWDSKLLSPTYCPHCKSPYWKNARAADKFEALRTLAPGQTLIVPWPADFATDGSQYHPVARATRYLSQRGEGRFYVAYDARGAIVTRMQNAAPAPYKAPQNEPAEQL